MSINLMDHHEPALAVAVPCPSAATVPSLESEQNNKIKTVSLEKENAILPEEIAKVSHNVSLAEEKFDDGKSAVASPLNSEVTGQCSEAKLNFSTSTNQNAQSDEGLLVKCSLAGITSSLPRSLPQSQVLTSSTDTCTAVSPHVITHQVVSLLPKIVTTVLQTSASPVPSIMSTTITSTMPSTTTTSSDMAQSNILKPTESNNIQQPTVSQAADQSGVPLVIPEFQTGKINAKKFPPRHFELGSLAIGSWKYESKSETFFSSITSRLKVIFSQKKFVYEFQLRADPGVMMFFQKEKLMACIEVPFSSVIGLNIPKENPNQVFIEVNSPPSMFLGKQVLHSPSTGGALPTKYDTTKTVDLTHGQLLTMPYHKVSLGSSCLKARLESFDPRFEALLKTPIAMDSNKRLNIQQLNTTQPAKHRRTSDQSSASTPKRSRKHSNGSSSSTGEGTCFCTSGCKTQRCSCVRTTGKCSDACKCVACRNPLNILADNGVDVTVARNDKCLMQNIFKIDDLETLLKENKEITPCCDVVVPFKDMCMGIVECPKCQDEYRFSWCQFSLCEEECRPRNHCPICKRCGDYRDQHCSRCNKCYFAGSSGSFKCPCEDRVGFIDSLGAFLNFFGSSASESDEEYY